MVKEKYLPFEEPSKEEETPKTQKEIRKSKWDNFWFYNKVKVWVGVLAAIMVGYTIWSMVSQIEPDYTVGMITKLQYSTDVIEALERQLSRYGEDRNGDGRVVVQIAEYVMEDADNVIDPNVLAANVTRFAGDAQTRGDSLYIADLGSLKKYTEDEYFLGYLTGEEIKEGAKTPEMEQISWPLQDAAFYTNEPVLEELQGDLAKLYFCVRANAGSVIEKHRSDYDAGLELLDRIQKNEVINELTASSAEASK